MGPTTTAALLSLTLVAGTVLVHFYLLLPVLRRVAARRWGYGVRMLVAGEIIVLVHCLEAALYAAGFAGGAAIGLGGFDKAELPMSALDYFYFSLVNFNTLGLGDIYPTEQLRMLAGIESLNGFLMISCSASFLHALATDSGFAKEARMGQTSDAAQPA